MKAITTNTFDVDHALLLGTLPKTVTSFGFDNGANAIKLRVFPLRRGGGGTSGFAGAAEILGVGAVLSEGAVDGLADDVG